MRAVEAAAEAIGSLNPREFDIRFNPDAYVPEVVPSKYEVTFLFSFLFIFQPRLCLDFYTTLSNFHAE